MNATIDCYHKSQIGISIRQEFIANCQFPLQGEIMAANGSSETLKQHVSFLRYNNGSAKHCFIIPELHFSPATRSYKFHK